MVVGQNEETVLLHHKFKASLICKVKSWTPVLLQNKMIKQEAMNYFIRNMKHCHLNGIREHVWSMWMHQTHHNHIAHIHLGDACHAVTLGIFCISKLIEKCVHTSYAQFHTTCLNLSSTGFIRPVRRDAIRNFISDPLQPKSQDNITKLIANTGFCIHPLTDEICHSLLMAFTNDTFPQYNKNYTFK